MSLICPWCKEHVELPDSWRWSGCTCPQCKRPVAIATRTEYLPARIDPAFVAILFLALGVLAGLFLNN